MKKRIQKHIDQKDFVKVYIVDEDDYGISHFEGYIFDQNDKLILMCDHNDFFYDGIIVLRKKDISEIKHSDNEKFLDKINIAEKTKELDYKKFENLKFKLDSWEAMFSNLKHLDKPLIAECKYDDDDRFIIGPVDSIDKKKVKIKYFNSTGEFDLKPSSVRFKDITFLRVDSPYANTFYRHVDEVK